MPNETPTLKKGKNVYFVLGLVLIVIFVAAIWASSMQKPISVSQSEKQQSADTNTPTPDGTKKPVVDPNMPEILKTATTVVPGANPISKTGVVLTPEGKPVKNDAAPMAPEAPRQTLPVDAKNLSKDVIQIGASTSGFSPKTFTVAAGKSLTISLSSVDGYSHVMVFDDVSLQSVAMGVAPSETRAISFNAPTKAGTYAFSCTVPGHKSRGEVGAMIVK
ncbi:MAG: cupredoxin domain-containing protein [Patescibacteria group bacterium]